MLEFSGCQAIIFDVDGTAIANPGGMPKYAVIDAIAVARDKGLAVCAATGRYESALAAFKVLGLADVPCIRGGGAEIVIAETGELIWSMPIPEQIVDDMLAICAPYGYPIQLGGNIWTSGEDRPTDVSGMYVLNASQGDAESICDALRHVPGVAAMRMKNGSGYYDVDITDMNATKGGAAVALMGMYNIPMDAVVGVGDGQNDMPLFQVVRGRRIAMGNAEPELIALADEVCPSVDEDGLAVVIRQCIGGLAIDGA
jgi:hydroxymethylpyrimidine pyrophosphatase-like HAD family hydrolase